MDKAIGGRIKSVRRAAGLTQEALSRRTELSLQAVGDIERGVVTDPHISSLRQIADALGMPVSELLREPADKPPPHLWSRLLVIGEPGEAGEEEEVSEPPMKYDFEAAAKRVFVWDELDVVVEEARAVGLNNDEITRGLLRHVAEWVLST